MLGRPSVDLSINQLDAAGDVIVFPGGCSLPAGLVRGGMLPRRVSMATIVLVGDRDGIAGAYATVV